MRLKTAEAAKKSVKNCEYAMLRKNADTSMAMKPDISSPGSS